MTARLRLDSTRRSLGDLAARMPGSNTAFSLYQRDRRLGGSVLAAGLAFRVFLMLLPLALLLSAALGFVAANGGRSVSDAAKVAGITGIVVEAISGAGGESREGRWLLLLIGFVLLVYTLNGVSRALHAVHAIVWQEDRMRPVLRSKILVPLGILLVCVIGTFASVLLSRLPRAGMAIEVVLITGTGAAWLLISQLLPHRGAPWRALLPGAIAVAAGIGIMHLVTVYYLPHKLGSTSHLYGSLGAAAALMSWLFLVCRLIVGAAALNAALWEHGVVLGGGPAESPG